MSESTFKNRILKYLNGLPGCKAIKMHGNQYVEAGTPDIFCCYRGRPVLLELKLPGNEPTVIQLKRLEEWRAAGAVAEWVTSLEDVRRIIEGI